MICKTELTLFWAGLAVLAAARARAAMPEADLRAGRPVSFEQALGMAALSPRVQAAGRSLEVKRRYNERIATTTLNPSLGVQPGYRLLERGDREPEALLDIVQPWNLAGHGQARRASASLEADVLAAEARHVALVQRLGAARAWVELWAAEQVLAAALREDSVAEELEARVAKAQSLGAVTRADLADAKAFHAEIRALAIAARGEVVERGLHLARQMGVLDDGPLVTAGELPDPPLPPTERQPAVLDHLQGVPAVVVAELAARAQRSREVEEQAARGTVLALGIAGQRDAPGGLVVSAIARLSFPLFDRGERERGVLAAEAERLRGEREQAVVDARQDLLLAIREVGLSAELLAELRDDLVPAAREGAETRRRLFLAGGTTMVEVLQSDRVAIGAVARWHRATAAHAWAKVRLWLLLSTMALARTEVKP